MKSARKVTGLSRNACLITAVLLERNPLSLDIKMYILLTVLHIFLRKLARIICLRVPSFRVIRIRISDPTSFGSWCIKGTNESTLDKDPSVLLMHYDPSDPGSLILIWTIPKEHTLNIKTS